MPMLPWTVWPLAVQAKLGQNVVAGSMRVSSKSRWGTYPEEVCLDPHFHGKHTIPRLSVELPMPVMSEVSRISPLSPRRMAERGSKQSESGDVGLRCTTRENVLRQPLL